MWGTPWSIGFRRRDAGMKWQVSPIPGKIDLSITIGAALPAGATAIAGPGHPALHAVSLVDRPRARLGHHRHGNELLCAVEPGRQIYQSIEACDREGSHRTLLSIEHVGDYLVSGGTGNCSIPAVAIGLPTPKQIDFHIGFGLNNNAPAYIFGIGYSFRLDGLFDGSGEGVPGVTRIDGVSAFS